MRKFNFRYQISVFLLFALLCGCKASKPGKTTKKAKTDGEEILLISIDQSACMGKCPDYSAQFFTGRKMIYEGRNYMPVLGKFEYFIPAELTKNLLFEATKMNLKLVPDSMPIPPDVSVIRLTVVLNGKEKTMVGWTGFGNSTFNSFVKLVHNEVRSMIVDQEGMKFD